MANIYLTQGGSVIRIESTGRGLRGLQGLPGPSGDSVSLVAAIALSGHRVIATDEAGLGVYADHRDASALAACGFSTGAVSEGAEVTLQSSGLLDWPAANLTEDLPVFLGESGQITQTPPSSGWARQVGIARSQELLQVDFGPAYRLES